MSDLRCRSIQLAVLLGSIALLVLPLSAWAQLVTSTDAMRKIKVDTDLSTIPTSPSASISAAKNEFEAFQIIVQGPATNVSTSVTNFLSGASATLRAASCGVAGNIRLYREAIINITQPTSAPHGGIGGYPDGLVPNVDELDNQCRNAFPFTVPPGENRVIWVEVYVPANAAPGKYTGNVVVSYTGGSATIPVTLTVWDFALPSTASLRSYFGMSYGGIYQQHVYPRPCCTDEHAEIRYKYSQFALDHRISTPNFDDGWGIGDFSHYDSRYGPLIDGTAATQLAGAMMTSVDMIPNCSDMPPLYNNWADHFMSHPGWFDRLFAYIVDEPEYQPPPCGRWADIRPRASYAHLGDPPYWTRPNFRTLVATSLGQALAHCSPPPCVSNVINLFALIVTGCYPPATSIYCDSEGTRAQYETWLQLNPGINEIWEYISCSSHGCGSEVDLAWPDYVIDQEMIQGRALEWITFRNKLTGELYYDTTYAYAPWPPDPNADPWQDQFYLGGNGDGTLLLPGTPLRVSGTTHIPIATLRMKMIREGMEDYEYMKILENQGDRAFAESQIDRVFPTHYSTDADPNLLYNARRAMACRILGNAGGSCPAP